MDLKQIRFRPISFRKDLSAEIYTLGFFWVKIRRPKKYRMNFSNIYLYSLDFFAKISLKSILEISNYRIHLYLRIFSRQIAHCDILVRVKHSMKSREAKMKFSHFKISRFSILLNLDTQKMYLHSTLLQFFLIDLKNCDYFAGIKVFCFDFS